MVKSKSLSLFVKVSLVTVILDQIIKYMISIIKPNFAISILKIKYLTNTGAGFGILQGKLGLLTFISVLVTAILIFFYKEIPKIKSQQILFALFLGGVVGNLIDRLFRGFVIDFIIISIWPAFNIADAAITLSMIGILITTWKN